MRLPCDRPQSLLDVAQAIGLVTATGDLDPTWFESPLRHLATMLGDSGQRAALFDLLDGIVPAVTVSGALPGAKWHPLLGNHPDGNVYLTVDDTATPIIVGLAGRYAGATASVLGQVPVLSISGTNVSAATGTAMGPVRFALTVTLNWTSPAHPIVLAGLSVALVFAPAASPSVANVVITLQGLDLDGSGAHDVTLDPADIGTEAVTLAIGLIRDSLAQDKGNASAAALSGVLGLDGSVPAFPFATLATDPQALTSWLKSLSAGSAPPLSTWLRDLAALLGVTAPAVTTTTSGTKSTFSVTLFAPNPASTVSIGLIRCTAPDAVTPTLGLQVGAALVPAGAAPVALNASATLFAVALTSSAPTAVLPAASVVVRAPAGAAPLIAASTGQFSIDSLQAGIAWDGSSIVPLLEMENVVVPGAGTYPTIDLTNANTVIASAAAGFVSAVINGLGSTGAGAALAALAGLIEPSTDTTAPLVDFTALATSPTAAIATLHRNALLSATHPWSMYLAEIATLLSLPGAVTGTGTPANPWSIPLGNAGPLTATLVGWNAQSPGNAADPQELRIGLRVGVSAAPITVSCTSVLFAADMPASGSSRVSVFAEHDTAVSFGALTFTSGTTALATSGVSASFSLVAGSPPVVSARINDLTVTTANGSTLSVPMIAFPFPGGFDPANPAPVLGISAAQLGSLAGILLASALNQAFGAAGTAFSVVLGCGTGAPGLQADIPGISDLAAATLFTDPAASLRTWWAGIAGTLSADGTVFVTPVVQWLAAALGDTLPDSPYDAPQSLAGAGTYDQPWIIPLGSATSALQGLLWFEPAGPATTAAASAAAIMAATDYPSLITAVQAAARYLGPWSGSVDPQALAAGLASLENHFATTDGVVPVMSELLSGGSWGSATPLTCAHPNQPGDPTAISQILAQLNAWAAPGTPRAILLLGPAFSDHTVWNALLAQASAAHPGSTGAAATFNLRVAGVAPASIDLRPVTAVVDFYTADLQDDGSNNIAGLVAQIALVVARLNVLRPGAPVMLVAHSTAGVAARAYAAANPSAVRGLATIGTPHQGAPLTPLTDEPTADALRVVADWLPDGAPTGLPAGNLQDALTHLLHALDGYLPAQTAGALPVRWPYPIANFTGGGTIDTGGVPALTLGGQIGGAEGISLLGSLQAALAARVTAAAAAPPTHLAFGVQAQLALNTQTSNTTQASALLRIDGDCVALQSGAAPPARALPALTGSVSFMVPGGWLVGDPRSYAGTAPAVDVRVRNAQLGLTTSLKNTARATTPFAALNDVAFHGETIARVGWNDPTFNGAIGAILSTISTAAAAPPGSSVAALLALLQALGIATGPASPGAPVGIAADALNALAIDAASYLAPKLTAALASDSVPGFAASPAGGYVYQPATLPLEVFVTLSPTTIGIRTAAGSSGLAMGPSLTVGGSVDLTISTMQAAVSGALDAGPVRLSVESGTLTLGVNSRGVTLSLAPAPSAAAASAAAATLLPPLLISSVGTALLGSLVDPGNQVVGLYPFLQSPWNWLVQSTALGDGTGLDPVRLNSFFGKIGALPAGLTVAASGTDPVALTLTSSAPLGGIATINLGVVLDHTGHATPTGSISIATPTGGAWANVSVDFGVSAAGLSLSVTPAGSATIGLLPTFTGAAALAGAARKLLPDALDALLAATAPGAKPPLITQALNVATALDLYDSVGGFEAHAAQLAAMTGTNWFASLATTARSAFVTAANAYFNDPGSPLRNAFPGAITATGATLTWTFNLAPGTGSVSLSAGWGISAPTLSLIATNLALPNSPVATTLAGGVVNGAIDVSGSVGIDLQTLLGLALTPRLEFSPGAAASSLSFLPLGAGTATTLSVSLAPSVAVTVAAGGIEAFVSDWIIPLVADILIKATGASFATPIYAGGPSTQTLLTAAGVINVTAGSPPTYALKTPLPPVQAVLYSLLEALPAAPVTLSSNPALTLLPGNSNGQSGIGLQGAVTLASGSPTVSLLLGQPNDPQNVPGVQLVLFAPGATPTFAPSLNVHGIGVGFAGEGSLPLLNTAGFRLGDIDGFLSFDVDLSTVSIRNLGSGLSVGRLGLPLGLFDTVTGGNPVAASLLSSNGGSGGGDSSSVNPAVDVSVTYLNGELIVSFAGTVQPVVIAVRQNFGPLYIDQIDVSLSGTNSVSIGIVGSLSIDGLSVGVDELAVLIPLPSVLDPATWSIDLQGLAVGMQSGPVDISGGLRKNPGPPIEYDGMLSATVVDIGFTVVGAYSRPSDAQGGYTSLFLFATLMAPLGGPPFAFVTGLGGGFGYDRELLVPDDLNQLDSFVLVQAMDDDSLANDPMNALIRMGSQIPPRRGALWIAAGVRLTTFGLVNSTVIVSIALDRGLDIEVLGVSRMALPTENAALISVELALRARYNSSEQLLSVSAQLTDNSYLFSRDCQLTGGFAMVIWYGEGQFVLTLGGYNPVFPVPPQFPVVPRLGFNWSVGSLVVIKGGAYFALTNSCVMAGGSLSATASIGPVSAWFDTYLDILIAWDPFTYEFDVGVEIGASVSIRVCFFGCVTIGISISVGAQLQIQGPPFHGSASIDAYVTTITISFGDSPQSPPYITDWNIFATKYLTAGDPNDSAVSVQISSGLLPSDPPGAQPQPGTASQPWQLGVEFSLSTTTRMPASSCPPDWYGAPIATPANLNTLDLATMDRLAVTSTHILTIQQMIGGTWQFAEISDARDHFTVTAVQGSFPEAMWHWTDPQHMVAAARTIAAISGFTIDAHVVLNNESALIPISSLVNDQPQFAQPLPFATTEIVVPVLKGFGVAAAGLATAVASATSQQMLIAGTAILSGATGVFASNRLALGLPQQGLPPLATQALQRGRSAPPLLTPLTTGLTMLPVGLPSPVPATVLSPTGSVLLGAPRLRAVLQSVPEPVTDVGPAQHTTVTGLPPALVRSAPRMAPPGFMTPPGVAGARLIVLPAVAAPRPTRSAQLSRALRNADLGAAIGPAHELALEQAATALLAAGVTLGAGAVHVWDVPHDKGQFTIAGNAAVRIVCTDRAGSPLSDAEFVPTGSQTLGMAAGTAMVAIQCLGAPPASTARLATSIPAGVGAVTGTFAATGNAVAVGWQSASTLVQIGPSRFLARGALVRVLRAHASSRNGQRASYGTPRAADVVAAQIGVETRLPIGMDVVMIVLDILDPGAAQKGDLALAATGATLSATPERVTAGGRQLLIYDVAARKPEATTLVISVASVSGFGLAGVVGLHGLAVEWANRLSQGLPDQFVPDGALSPGGSLTVTYT